MVQVLRTGDITGNDDAEILNESEGNKMKGFLTIASITDINSNKEIKIRSVYEDAEHYNLLWRGIARTVQDYIDECLHGGNECAMLIEKIENAKTGKDIIVWFDEEADEVYISY